MKLRVLSFNVNGLRSLCNLHGGLLPLLESLQADIICFQEHKLRRDDLDPSIAIVPGWESFFAFNRTQNNKGYSGVCTFVRRPIGIPLCAEEGMTGFLALDRSIPKSKAPSLLGAPWDGYSPEVLESIEAEGRCLITDHGAFLVFNIYGPAITSDCEEKAEQRSDYKQIFFTALEMRLRQELAAGRRLLLLGDLNISPSPADTRDPAFTDERFYTQYWSRSWLRSLLIGDHTRSGPFTDTFRLFHPTRPQAFTCWSTATGARVHNWGSRIDLLLAADGADPAGQAVHSWVVDGDIVPEVQGSDHCPAWVDLELQQPLPSAASIPRASARFLFDSGTAKQAKLVSFFGRLPQQPNDSSGPSCAAVEAGAEAGRESSSCSELAAGRQQAEASSSNAAQGRMQDVPQRSSFPAGKPLGVASGSTLNPPDKNSSKSNSVSGVKRPAQQQLSMHAFLGRNLPPRPPSQPPQLLLPAALNPAQQQPLQAVQRTAFVQQQQAQQQQGNVSFPLQSCSEQAAEDDEEDEEDGGCFRSASAPGPQTAGSQSSGGDATAGAASWSFGSTPRCRHNEASVARTVKKKGVNRGREFYCCARPEGPKPQGRCDFFQWRFPQGGSKKQRQA